MIPQENRRQIPDFSGANVLPLRRALGDPEPVRDMEKFVDKLGGVGRTLEEARLPPGFNYVYWGLSLRVLMAMQRRPGDSADDFPRISNADQVEHTAGIFGEYYFAPLRDIAEYIDYADAQPERAEEALGRVTPPWEVALLDDRIRGGYSGQQFVSGMVSHILGRDLPGSLYASEAGEAYYADYSHEVNDLIAITTNSLAPELIPGHPVVRRRQITPVVMAIAGMREVAWQRSQRLKAIPSEDEREAELAAYDLGAARINRGIARFGRRALDVLATTERLGSADGMQAAA
ncbi:hypothetical protein JNJ66_01585 [Candidatus Saccharibacteria bacterium]|nr:hypothetical protein [Candidatus Saccharibacteria bacterium]